MYYDTALLLLRLVVGLYIAAHGARKLFGWFGGTGLQATINGFEGNLHFRPAPLWATVLSISETIGGAFMALGLLGPIGPVATAGATFSADAVLGLSVPQSVDLAFGILVLLGVVAAGLNRAPRQQASGGVVS